MDRAFYVAEGDRFASTELTRGPWDPDSQHAGPPAALLGRQLERCELASGEPPTGWQLARVTFEILRAVPIAPLAARVRVVRPGRTVELLEGALADRQGDVLRASAWRVRQAAVELPSGRASEDPASPSRQARELSPPSEAEAKPFFETGVEVGYHTAMEYRFVSGGFRESGPATVWMRMRGTLLDGEEPTPLARVLTVADSGNGVSATLDWSRFIFINVDLSVHLHRLPAGEWVCLDAVTTPEPNGIGVADTALHDERGPIGRAMQTLVVRERDG